jgi:hypothetical protein
VERSCLGIQADGREGGAMTDERLVCVSAAPPVLFCSVLVLFFSPAIPQKPSL